MSKALPLVMFMCLASILFTIIGGGGYYYFVDDTFFGLLKDDDDDKPPPPPPPPPPSTDQVGKTKNGWGPIGLMNYGNDGSVKGQNLDDCRKKAIAVSAIGVGFRNDKVPDADYKNTCFFYDKTTNDNWQEDVDLISACTDKTKDWPDCGTQPGQPTQPGGPSAPGRPSAPGQPGPPGQPAPSPAPVKVGKTKNGWGANGLMTYGNDGWVKARNIEDCREEAKRVGAIGVGFRDNNITDANYRNTCFFYSQTSNDNWHEDIGHTSSCTDEARDWPDCDRRSALKAQAVEAILESNPEASPAQAEAVAETVSNSTVKALDTIFKSFKVNF